MNDKIIKVGKTSLAAVVSASIGFSILDTTVLADEQNADSTVTEVQEDLVVNEEPNLETVVSEEQNLETSVSKEVPMKETESVQPMAANDNPVIMVMDTSVGDENGYTRLDLHFYDADLVDYVTINGVYRDLENDDDSNLNDQNAGYVNGTNTVVVYDVLGNSSTFTFNYIKASEDTTPPTVVSITYSNDNGNKVTKEDVVVTITANENLQPVDGWTVSGNVMTKTHSENGKYSVVMKDLAGNETIVNYEVKRIDKVPPVIEGITEGMVTNQDVTYTIIEQSISQIIIDGTVYNEKNAPKTITDEGLHTIKVIDKAGNETSVSFTIDRIGPTITVKEGSVGQDGIYSKIDLKLYDANKVDYVLINGKKKDLTDNTWSDVNFKDVQYKEGKNVVEAFDIAGNSSTFEFILDTKGPEITVKDSSIGKDGVYSRLDLKLYDANKVDYVLINGEKKDLTDNTWSDVNFKDVQSWYKEGKNTVICYDIAGNATEFTFIYDKTAPVIEANDRTINVGDDIDLMKGVSAYDGTVDLTNSIEVTGTVDNTKSGQYEITYKVTDQAGNTTEKKITITVNALPVFHADDITIALGDAFDPMQGVNAQDEEDGDLTDQIVIESNNVNVNVAGEYTIVYRVTDKSGASVTYTRNVTVEAPDTPVNPENPEDSITGEETKPGEEGKPGDSEKPETEDTEKTDGEDTAENMYADIFGGLMAAAVAGLGVLGLLKRKKK
ncbi:immunoglobulin-like domain-containing protein [Faecalicoccus pleomorphus]|uniref:immunoglobulin-like domain-containing protein n=1 Tax=Faecalicoccus pleomorphus TaxID=1323 RepID=UPI0022DEACAD|nr:immunoglobulin-like domain-containing protein [Faecalicoccus pleomorphus]